MNPYKNSNRTESSSLRARRIPTQIWRRKLPAAGRSRDLAWQLLRTATSPTRSTARSGPWIREENARSTGTRRATSYDYEEEEGGNGRGRNQQHLRMRGSSSHRRRSPMARGRGGRSLWRRRLRRGKSRTSKGTHGSSGSGQGQGYPLQQKSART